MEPLLPLDLVAGPLGAAVSLTFLGQVLSVSVGFHMPLVLEETGGLSPARSGAWLAVLPLAALALLSAILSWLARAGSGSGHAPQAIGAQSTASK